MSLGNSIAVLVSLSAALTLTHTVPESTAGQQARYTNMADRPWTRVNGGLIKDNLFQIDANVFSEVVLSVFHSVERYREGGAAAGLVDFANLDISAFSNNLQLTTCYITDNLETLCVAHATTQAPLGYVASAINQGHGKTIAGIYNGVAIVAPGGAIIPTPANVTLQSGSLYLIGT